MELLSPANSTYHPVACEVFRTENDPNRIRRWSSAGQRRTSPGMLLRVAGCSRYTTQLLSQPHTALLTQISTHAVHLAWSRARMRDNNTTTTSPRAKAVVLSTDGIAEAKV
jgi:hypothetical protein